MLKPASCNDFDIVLVAVALKCKYPKQVDLDDLLKDACCIYAEANSAHGIITDQYGNHIRLLAGIIGRRI